MFGVLPWFLPGTAVSLLVGLLVAPWLASRLGCSRAIAVLLVVSLGMVLSATVTPLHGALEEDLLGVHGCDLRRIALAPLGALGTINDTSLNILLFIPLGAAIGAIPGSSRKLVLVVAAIALPFGIEILQLLVPVLGRGCQSADVVDNLTGLAIGMVVATAFRWLGSMLRPEG